jgi:hypothetical protein
MQPDQIAVGAFLGALTAYAVKGLVDYLFACLAPQAEKNADEALADAAWREIDRVRLRQRTSLYREFDTKLMAAVAEMAQGWNRMSLVYAARDQFFALRRHAPDPVIRAAQRMCDICVEMMSNGYSDLLHNRFHRAQIEYHEACRADLAAKPNGADDARQDRRRKKKTRHKYITPHH